MNSKNWILLKALVKTDFKLRYQDSLIGHLWSILKPLMQFSVLYLVFVQFLKFGKDVPDFALALLLGMVIWGFFAEATSTSLTSIVMRGDLLRKVSFPKEIIVLSVTVNAFINFLINLVVVLFFSAITHVSVSWDYVSLAPLYIFPLFAFSLGVSFILATIFVYFRDIGPLWEVAMQAGLYLTPIIYPLSLIIRTDKIPFLNIPGEKIISLMFMNPLATIIQDLRHILINPANQTIHEFIHSWIIAIPYILPFVVLIIGYIIFKKHAKKFAEII